MTKTTAQARARRWLDNYLRHKTVRHGVHPSNRFFTLERSEFGRTGNVWITITVSLLCGVGNKVSLSLSGNRCGPDARCTCDGPIENDHAFGNPVHREWAEFDDHALAEMKQIVVDRLPALVSAFDAEVAKLPSYFTEEGR